MAIQPTDVKLMASQRLTDNEDGGGRMTGVEVVDGNVNNLFPDISRLDRVYGRVSLRKAFVSVQTADTDTYSGCHVILSVPAADPLVSVCLFSTSDPHDERDAARDRVESYAIKGPRFPGWLWGTHPEGSRALKIFAPEGAAMPDVGDVLFLGDEAGEYQFVRITSVSGEAGTYTVLVGSGYTTIKRLVMDIEIGDPLRYSFTGQEMSGNDALAANIYTTVVQDAAKYYGVMRPTAAIADGAVAINVDSIFTHLVPSAQGESPLTDLSPGEAGPVVGSGGSVIVSKASFVVVNGAQLWFGRGIKPGTLTITHGANTYTDAPGDGVLYQGTTGRGTVDYATGTITFTSISGTSTATATMTAVAGCSISQIVDTIRRPIILGNQGYNYTAILEPLPARKSLVVDYMSQGKWYRLRDNGDGTLAQDISGTGTGTINYSTGSVVLTCAALPDIDTSIIFAWGSPLEVEDAAGAVTIDIPEVVHQLAEHPVMPGSISITWDTGSGTATATDSNGLITGDATGYVDYSAGKLFFRPTLIPASGTEYDIEYDKYPVVTGAGACAGNQITLPAAPVKPGSAGGEIQISVSGGAPNHRASLRDNGNGTVSVDGVAGYYEDGGTTFQRGSSSQSYKRGTIPGISGTIDYNTGVIVLDLVSPSGSLFTYAHTSSRSEGSYNYSTSTQNTVLTYGTVVSLACQYTLAASAQQAATESIPAAAFTLDLTEGLYGKMVVPGSVDFLWGGVRHIDRLGIIYSNPDPATGAGVQCGTIDYDSGVVTMTTYASASNTITLRSMLVRWGKQITPNVFFRTPGAPLRPGSFQILGSAQDGRQISATASFDGTITGTLCRGEINYDTGIVELFFGEMVTAAGNEGEPWYDPETVSGGLVWKPLGAIADTLTYTCVAYSYIPLDADLLGLDPVRLPSDGRVPIVRVGDVVVVHNTKTDQLPGGLTAGQIITLSRAGVVHCECYDANGLYVPTTKYTWDADAQTLTMADPLDLTGYTQPLIAMHRIEDMRLVSGVQINGQIIVSPGLDHAYEADGTYVSTALLYGDLAARAYGLFDQKTWTSVWSDELIGDATNAGYNEVNYPITTTNKGATGGRWALVFTDTTHFNILEEKLGIIGDGYITQDCQPLNPATTEPYFFIDYRGWGAGWVSGNVLRFNTDGATAPLWIARTTLQGPVTEPEDQFTIQIRGDAE